MSMQATGKDILEIDEMDQPKMSSALNVLTILTFIGCVLQLVFLFLTFSGAKDAYEKKDEMIAKMNSDQMPSFFKNMMPSPDVYEKLVAQQYHNRMPILILGLIAILLCFYGALEMRKLKKQGFLFYIIGELLPFVTSLFFIGLFSFAGFSFYFGVAITLLFILLYNSQRKRLVY